MADQIKRINVIAEFTAKTKELDQKVDRIKKNVTGLSGFFKQAAAAAAGLFALQGITAFARRISQLSREVVNLADQQLKAEAKLLSALKGRRDLQTKLLQQASKLQEVTLFGDEQTIEAQSRLAALLGDQEGAIERLIPLVQDFATAKQVDLATAAELVAKSVGSQTNALSRYGIQIEGAVGSTERLDSAVTALNEQFGGQAQAAFKAGAGSIQAYNNLVGDLQEEIGKRLLPVMNKWAERNSEVVKSLIEFVKIPVAKQLREEQTELNILVGRLANVIDNEEERNKILLELKATYPDYLKLIGDEVTNLTKLQEALDLTNKQYIARIALAEIQADIDKKKAISDNASTRAGKAEVDIFKLLNKERTRSIVDTGKETDQLDERIEKTVEALRAVAEYSDGVGQLSTPLNAEALLLDRLNILIGNRTALTLRGNRADEKRNEFLSTYNNLLEAYRKQFGEGFLTDTPTTPIIPPDAGKQGQELLRFYEELSDRIKERIKLIAENARKGLLDDFVVSLLVLNERAAQSIDLLVNDTNKAIQLLKSDDLKLEPIELAPEQEEIIPAIEEQLNALANSLGIVSSAFSSFYQTQIDGINDVISARRDEISEFKSLAERGNAEQLQLEEERLNNLIGLRERFQQRQAALNAVAVAGAQSVAAAGAIKALFDPEVPTLLRIANALAAVGAIGTIISAVNSAFGSIPSFAEGEEYLTGRPGSGIPMIAHEGERIVPKSVNKTLAGIPNTMLPEMAAFYQRFNPTVNQDVMMSMKGNDDLLIEMKGLRREMKMMRKKGTNLNLEVNVRADESKKRAAILK